MNFAIFLIALAVPVACVFACDPLSDNKPDCSKAFAEKLRHFFDPNYYWVCENGEAVAIRCEDEHGFDEATETCVPFDEFEWTEPCSQEDLGSTTKSYSYDE